MTKTYHFIGIKGSGMSALALMLHQMGHKVQGSDVDKYYFTQRGLEQAGIPILPVMPSVQITMWKLPMQMPMVLATSATMNFWVALCVTLSA